MKTGLDSHHLSVLTVLVVALVGVVGLYMSTPGGWTGLQAAQPSVSPPRFSCE